MRRDCPRTVSAMSLTSRSAVWTHWLRRSLAILAKLPLNADGTTPRLGNVNAILYELASLKGVFTQPDASETGLVGNWEAATGLGVVDLGKLAEWFPRGSLTSSVAVTVSNPGAVHGQSITFSAAVKDISGQGNGAVPSGTVTFTTNNGVTLGPVTLSNGSASVTTSTLDASYSYTITALYSGDGTYASSSASTGFTIGPEAAGVSAVVSSSTPLGGNISVAVTITSKSGVGTPTGTATVAPQGTSDTKTYSAPLTGANGSATATVTVPTVQAGNITLLVNCSTTSANFSCYTSLAVSANVTLGKSTTTVTTSTTNSVTTITATVAGLGTGYPTPTGNITFYNNGVSIGSATLSAGTASTQISTPTGTPSYSAAYGGDNNYSASSSNQSPTGTAASATTLTITPNPPVSGSTTTLQATVASAKTGTTAVPTGSVTFYQDGVAIASAVSLSATGVATFTSTTLSDTTAHVYSAIYSGDGTYVTSTSNSVASVAASALTSTTTLQFNPSSGTLTSLTATVAGGPAGVTLMPTGTVTFYQDGVALSPSIALTSVGISTYTAAGLYGTGHTYYAKYSGDGSFPSSASTPQQDGSTAGATTLALTISSNPPVANTNNVLTATLGYTATANAAPTGTVTFYQDGVALNPGGYALTGTTAVFVSRTLNGATAHVYTAVYSGDTIYNTSTSNAITTLAASSLATTTALQLTPNPPVTGASASLIATVTPSPSTTTLVPTGTVTFYQDNVALSPSATLTAAGTATFTSSTLAGTGHVYSAKYSGDTNFPASTSASVMAGNTVAGATTTSLAVSPNPPVSGSTSTLTATIGYTANGTAVPTGSVTFYQDGVALSPAAAVVGGTTATYTSTTLSGTTSHTYYAVYAGDTNYTTSKSSVVTTPAAASGSVASTTTISAGASTVTTGGTVTLTAAVSSGSASSTTVPTGTVTFVSSTQGVLGTATVNAAGIATLAPVFTLTGAQAITATYSGDTTYASSTSVSAAIVTVGQASTVNPSLTLSVSPTNTTYGSTVTLSSTVTAAITSGTVPVGTVTWTLTPNAGGTGSVYSAVLSATSASTGVATITITAPAVGTYTVTATCAGVNFSCTGLSAVAGLSVGKAPTTVTLVATPSPPVTGQPELLTAYIQLTSGATSACTGIVTFYVNSASVGTAQVSGNQTSYVLTLPSASSNTIYAVYSGDLNCQQSISTIVTLAAQPAQTLSTITVSSSTVLQGANVVLQVVVTAIPSASIPNPGFPTGTINFYDTFNGVQSVLGSASLVQNGPNSALATFSTTGLKDGTHSIEGQFAGSRYFSPSDAGSVLVNVTDFGVAFSPSSTSVTKGQTATVLTTVTAINNFSGQVVLGCVPPASSAATCTFSPNVLTSGSGIATLTITTTAATTGALRRSGWSSAGEIAAAFALLGLLWPGSRRRRPVLLALLLSVGLVAGSVGCSTVRSDGSSTGTGSTGTGGTSTSGTPSGTLQFNITGAGTDGRTTNMHTYQYSVTVQ